MTEIVSSLWTLKLEMFENQILEKGEKSKNNFAGKFIHGLLCRSLCRKLINSQI